MWEYLKHGKYFETRKNDYWIEWGIFTKFTDMLFALEFNVSLKEKRIIFGITVFYRVLFYIDIAKCLMPKPTAEFEVGLD